MASTYTDTAMGARTVGARTDNVGTPATDVNAEEDRYAHFHMGEGALTLDAFEPVLGLVATMEIIVGGGVAKADHYVVAGQDAGQGNYVVRLDAADVAVTLNAADPTFDRIDEIYIVVQDNAYDASGNALPRLGVRDGTPSASPAAPGADAGWDAYVLIASVTVDAAATDILTAILVDERLDSDFAVRGLTVAAGMAVIGNISVTGTVDGVDLALHAHTGADGSAAIDAGDLTGTLDADTLDGIDSTGFVVAAHAGAGGTAHADAIAAGAAGFMTGADKTKIDSQDTGAADDQVLTGGTDITVSGSPDYTIDHGATGGATSINNSGAEVIDVLTIDATGHLSNATKRTMTPAELGASDVAHDHDGDYYTAGGANPTMTAGTIAASGGADGDIYFRY